ncbi:unnamed protein product [Schistocephalus solidus]|uniref:Uncharacterized protein n=1 Tax=Schistocephalus solidus TaxID=70667 RepID=A0A183TI26_SCHSO|nr:unnamed protein product [Schistocephalus solidus]
MLLTMSSSSLTSTAVYKLLYYLSPDKERSEPSRPRLADSKIRGRKIQTNKNTPHPHPISPYPPGCSDNPRSNRPERRTALVASELARYKVDVVALSDTRFLEQGQLEEAGTGCSFFWSGRPKAE